MTYLTKTSTIIEQYRFMLCFRKKTPILQKHESWPTSILENGW